MINKELLYKRRDNTKQEILEKLKTCNKFGVVRPQGFGKSYIITDLCKILKGNKLVIEPNEGINEYIEQFGLSDTTDCITYHRLLTKDFNHKSLLEYDYIFLDEMHRALAPTWGKVLKDDLKNYKGKLVGFSATPIRGDGLNSIQKLFNGEQISELNLIDAILMGILPQPTYVTGIYEITEEDTKLIVKNETLAKQFYDYNLNNNLEFIFKKYLDLTPNKCLHIIVFCHKITDIVKAKQQIEKWIDIRPVKHYEVHSENKKETNNKNIKDFENAKTGLNIIYSANMLNEGIHPKKLDAVVFLRKTKSNVVYKQQLGRTISEYLEEPIVFDLVNNVYNIEKGYMKEFIDYANKNNIKFENIKTDLGEPLKIYEEQKDFINLLYLAKNKNNNLLSEEEKKFIEDNRLNMTVNKMANELNRGKSTVFNYLKRNNLDYKRMIKGFTEEEKKFIEENRLNMTAVEVASKLNRNKNTIFNYLTNNNLEYKKIKDMSKFTEEEKKFIEDNRLNMAVKEIASKLNRSKNSIFNYLERNNLDYKRVGSKPLSEEEKQFIEENRLNMTAVEIASKLDKKYQSIQNYLKRNNLDYKKTHNDWTEEEKKFVEENRLNMTVNKMANELNKSKTSIFNYLNHHNLDYKRMPKEFTEREKQFIEENRLSATPKEIANKLDKCEDTIRNYLSRNNLDYKKLNIFLSEEEKQFIEENRLNITAKEIASKLNRKDATIISYLKRNKLEYKATLRGNYNVIIKPL